VTAASFVDTLKGPGPSTLFAPADKALAKLAKGTADDLLKPENNEGLVGVLAYPVLPSKASQGRSVLKTTVPLAEHIQQRQ
jgi:uncharacterized surface protein with fasciclin (FAS1) repeats